MNLSKRFRNMPHTWFYESPPPLLRLITIYVKGDAIVIVPMILLIGAAGFFSVRFMLLLYGIFYAARGMGELVYWIHQQFGKKTYRPDDFGLKNLDNNAVYILYQLLALKDMVIGIGFSAWVVLYLYG